MSESPSTRQVRRPTSKEAQSEDLHIGDIWHFIVRRRYTLLAGAILGMVLGLVSFIKAPRLYTSTVMVEMNKDATSGLGLQDLSGAGSAIGIGQDFMTDMLTQQAILLSDGTALSVIERLNLLTREPYRPLVRGDGSGSPLLPPGTSLEQSAALRDRVVAVFESKLKAAPVKNTRLLVVSYTDPDPVLASQVANAVVEAYLTNHTKNRYEATTKASTWLNEQLLGLKQHAEDVQRQVADMERNSGIISMATPAPARRTSTGAGGASAGESRSSESVTSNPEYEQLMTLGAEFSRAQLNRIQQGTIFRLAQTSDPNALLDASGAQMAMADGTPLAASGSSMQLIQVLRTQKASLQLQLAAQKVTYAARNPAVVELQNQVASIDLQLKEEMVHVRAQAKKNYELAQADEDAVRRQVEVQRQKVTQLGNRFAALSFLREEEETSRMLYQDLYTRLEEANIAAGVRSSGMAVVNPARPPSRLSSPSFNRDLAAGLAGGLLVGLLVGLLQHVRDTSINVPEEFVEASPYPMLGVVPSFTDTDKAVYGKSSPDAVNQSSDNAWILRAPQSQVAEAYRQIRTSILLANVDTRPQVMLFSSPLSGDGKSTTTYNLAAAFAAQTSRVLLIDADMRRSTIGKLAGFAERRGLSDILSGAMTFDDLVQVNEHLPSLSVLVAGTIPPDPAELLGSKRFADLILELRKLYDYILIDAPPVLLLTDPIVASTVADGTVVVVRAGKTRRPALKRLWIALDLPQTHVLGFIVNDFDRKSQSYGYGYEEYGSGYYGSYGSTEAKNNATRNN